MGVLKVPKRTSFLRSIWNRGIAPKPKGDIAKAPVAAVSSRSAKPKNDEKGAHQKGDSNLFKSKQINSNQPVEAAAPAKVVITQAQIKKLKRRVSIAYRRLRRVRKWAGKQKHPSYRKAARDVYQSLSRARKQIKGGHVQAAALNYLRATVLLGRLKTNRRVEQNLSTQVETGTSLISQRSSSTRIFHMVYDAPAAEQKNGNELLGDFRTKLARERKQLSKTGARMIYAEPKQYKRLARVYSHRAKRVAKLVHRYQLYKKVCAGHKEVNLRLTGLAAQNPAWDGTFKALHGASIKLEELAAGVLSGRSSKEVAVELRTIERDYNKQELIARQLITAKAAKRFHKQLEALSQSAYSDPVKAAVQKEVFNNPRTKGVWRRLKVLGSRWGKLSAPDLLEYQVLYKEYNVRMQCIQFKLMHDRGAAHNNHFRYQIDKMGSELRGHYLAAKAI
ncbi:MAG: hypothetical protein HQ564_06130, partial [Candidatus Saganbacteria bacterium]|nr:hypothetical protein [Candidatus Saganbacteria bacterium]